MITIENYSGWSIKRVHWCGAENFIAKRIASGITMNTNTLNGIKSMIRQRNYIDSLRS